ncbi:uncharacterized protein LOC143298546 [Babylonia areolata]|uniref:uncharacterized protein LOC143298546 n=1 Tax=Babylonia areolata TaxID=304850 RepID=UPI003FCFBBF5
MATGHVLPGYGDPISRLRRVQSAGYPLGKRTLLKIAQETRLEQTEMDAIRQNARRLWSYKDCHETTYDDQYAERPADGLVTVRPTSPTRRNKPHPLPVFLTNRLHYIPGYQNADTTVGKDAYKVDASVLPEEREQRTSVRKKYIGRPDSAMVSPYRDPFGVRDHLDDRSAQAAEAWLKIADDKDRGNVMHVIEKYKAAEGARCQKAGISPRPATAYPSTHRWMRYAGAKEADAVGRIVQMIDSDPDKGYAAPEPAPTLLSLRRRDIAATANVRIQRPKPSRGDFLMHPDWPPSIYHHRIP